MPRLSTFPTLLLAGPLLLTPPHARAQSPSGTIHGSVQSSEQQPLAEATVQVVHLPSSHVRTAVADEAGRFDLANLPLGGPYIIKVSRSGYRAEAIQNVFLSAAQAPSLTFKLQPTGRPGRKPATLVPPAAASAAATLATAPPEAPPAAEPVLQASAKPASGSPHAPGEPPRTYAHRPRYAARPAPKVTPATPGHYDAKTGNYIYETGAPVTLRLPDGQQIKGVGAQATESLLYRFLTDPQQQVDTVDLTKGWINFDRVFFEPGKATLTPESQAQLRNVAALLKAYPRARVKIGGYTDSTGLYKVNRELSEARARTAWAALLEMGVAASRIEARGYGPRYAIAPNASEEGRAMNRRLSVKVLQK